MTQHPPEPSHEHSSEHFHEHSHDPAHRSMFNREWLSQVPPIFTGLVLLTSGALKGIDLVNGSTSHHLLIDLLELLMELAIGIWLISGRTARTAAQVTICLFLVFAGVSAYRGVRGDASCGCFGPVHVNPWITVTLDLFILGIMAWSMRRGIAGKPRPAGQYTLRNVAALLLVVALVWMGFRGSRYWRPAYLHADGQITGGHGLLFTTPPGWYGRNLPVQRFITGGGSGQVANQLSYGRWLVIIYYHGCPECQQAIASLARHYRQKKPAHIHIALLQLPPWGHLPAHLAPADWLKLKLDRQFTWRINPGIPSLVNLRDGKVTRVRVYAPGTFNGF